MESDTVVDDPMIAANPDGLEPHGWINGQTFTDQDKAMFLRHVQEVKDVKGTYSHILRDAVLNKRQSLAVERVTEWAKEVQNYNPTDKNSKYPKALRLFIIGIPCAGKTFAFKCLVGQLMTIFGESEWQDKVVFATATGAASFHMGFHGVINC